jgi:DNA-binding Lrp family transcriptional regulator
MVPEDVELLRTLTDPGSMEILRLLLTNGPARQRDVASELSLTPVAVSRALAKLEQEGVVFRSGARAPYELRFEGKTAALVEAAGDLSSFILEQRSQSARKRADEFRKARMSKRSTDSTSKSIKGGG